MNFIQVRNIHKVYNQTHDPVAALRNVSLGIQQGEFVTVMGPSGSGKSTFLSVLGALSRPTRGSVVVDDIDVYQLSVEERADFRREYLGFVFQSFQLIPYLTILENVMLPMAIIPIRKKEKVRSAEDIIHKVGLESKMRRLPDELSGGEQQRVAIARALVNEPPIVLADEPTGNLDTATSYGIMHVLRELNRDGHTIVMVTHNPENVQPGDQRIELQDGTIRVPDLFTDVKR